MTTATWLAMMARNHRASARDGGARNGRERRSRMNGRHHEVKEDARREAEANRRSALHALCRILARWTSRSVALLAVIGASATSAVAQAQDIPVSYTHLRAHETP